MKIHSNVLEYKHLREAAAVSSTLLDRSDRSGSRDRDHKWDVILEGESGRRTNQRWVMGEEYATEAATWDQWGIFLGYLFEVDPEMVCGSVKYPAYASAEDFHHKTGHRFDRSLHSITEPNTALVVSTSSPDYKITPHRWTYDYETSRPWSGETTLTCKGHNASRNYRAECEAVLNR